MVGGTNGQTAKQRDERTDPMQQREDTKDNSMDLIVDSTMLNSRKSVTWSAVPSAPLVSLK